MGKFTIGYILGVVVCALTVCVLIINKPLKSEVKIEPSIELVIKDNKVDTLYVYTLKK